MSVQFGRLLRTAAYLRPSQLGWRLVHEARLRLNRALPANREWLAGEARFAVPSAAHVVASTQLAEMAALWREGAVEYLALRGDRRDWQASARPRLWRYEHHYHSELVALAAMGDIDGARELRASWISASPQPHGDAWEPYPVARRAINWALAAHLAPTLQPLLAPGLAAQARFLARHLEHHLLGNHIICDAAALLVAGAALDAPGMDESFTAGSALLGHELERQVLPDGGYAERTAQYHAIVLRDVLIALAFSRLRGRVPDPRIERAARAMASWLASIARGDAVPYLNDAAPGSSPPVSEVLSLARALRLVEGPWDSWLGRAFALTGAPEEPATRGDVKLPDTGWFIARDGAHELLFEHGPIGPDEQPGHGHSDALSYELFWDGQPVVTDTGVTTYEQGSIRDFERSAPAHATVSVGGQGPDELWAAFRVGARGRVRGGLRSRTEDGMRILEGEVFAPAGWTHRRTLIFSPGEALVVLDRVDGARGQVLSHVPLSPECSLEGDLLRLRGAALQFVLLRGTRGESEGWVGEGFGRRRPRKVIEIAADRTSRAAYALLAPGHSISLDGNSCLIRGPARSAAVEAA